MSTDLHIAVACGKAWGEFKGDEKHLVDCLRSLGCQVESALWTDPSVDWERYDRILIRSCWDYHLRPGQFESWLQSLESRQLPVWNPPGLVRWNMHKRYLLDLDAHGIPVIPTVLVDAPTGKKIEGILQDKNWDEFVLKPAISASSHQTFRLRRGDPLPSALGDTPHSGSFLLQPLARPILEQGEWSLIFIDGEYSHAMLKQAVPGEFRVQEEFGGIVRPARPPESLIAQASDVMESIQQETLYARVDGYLEQDRFTLMELELIEPYLYLQSQEGAGPGMARALVRRAQ